MVKKGVRSKLSKFKRRWNKSINLGDTYNYDFKSAKENLLTAKEAEKKRLYGLAGRQYLEASRFLGGEKPRLAARYASKAVKEFQHYLRNETQDNPLVTIDNTPVPIFSRGSKFRYANINSVREGDIEEATRLAKVFRYEAARKKKGLGSFLGMSAFLIIGVAGIFFLSPNITGNVIGNNSINSSNLIGAILFLIGIVGLFFTFKRNK